MISLTGRGKFSKFEPTIDYLLPLPILTLIDIDHRNMLLETNDIKLRAHLGFRGNDKIPLFNKRTGGLRVVFMHPTSYIWVDNVPYNTFYFARLLLRVATVVLNTKKYILNWIVWLYNKVCYPLEIYSEMDECNVKKVRAVGIHLLFNLWKIS